MKTMTSVSLVFALAAIAPSAFAQSISTKSLPYKDCIRLDQINEWHVVDPQTAIVRTGPYQRYLIKLKARCDKLGIGNRGLQFLPSKADQATAPMRICGGAGERVRASNQPPCAIDSVSLIDESSFDAYRQQAKSHTVRTQQQSTHP